MPFNFTLLNKITGIIAVINTRNTRELNSGTIASTIVILSKIASFFPPLVQVKHFFSSMPVILL